MLPLWHYTHLKSGSDNSCLGNLSNNSHNAKFVNFHVGGDFLTILGSAKDSNLANILPGIYFGYNLYSLKKGNRHMSFSRFWLKKDALGGFMDFPPKFQN